MNIVSSHFFTYICTNQDRMGNKQANPHISVVELNLSLLLLACFLLWPWQPLTGLVGKLMEQISFNEHLDFYAKGKRDSRGV